MEYVPWQELKEAIDRWRQDGLIQRFFFLRKPPGLRLRFYGENLYAKFIPLLVEWLEENEKLNNIRGYRFAIYEPEAHRFGGEVGMEIAHDHFNLDSDIILAYELAGEEIKQALSPQLFSLLRMQAFFTLCVDDQAEVWDVWKQLESLLNAGNSDSQKMSSVAPENMNEEAHHLIVEAQEKDAMVARLLRSAQISCSLNIGIRQWLVAASVFHWNRMGFTYQDIRNMINNILQGS